MKISCPNCFFKYKVIPTEKVQRTSRQNRWYWSCVVGIPASEIGYSSEEMHDAYKWMYLKKKNDRGEDVNPPTIRSTTSLSTLEFSEYVEKCRLWASEQGYVIPDPEEVFTE